MVSFFLSLFVPCLRFLRRMPGTGGRVVLVLLILLLLPSSLFAYSFSSVSFSCGSDMSSSSVLFQMSLTNTVGMNIVYFTTDSNQFVMNLYGNVSSVPVEVLGDTDSGGNATV